MTYTERARALRPYIEKAAISLIDANVYSPAVYPAGWQEQA